MTASEKLAQKRLTLLQLAQKLGNVSRACRMHKVSRSQFYEYKRAFQTQMYFMTGSCRCTNLTAYQSRRS
jgi:ACT domain-containing protein